MPDGQSKTYSLKVGKNTYDVPEDKVAAFYAKYPDAVAQGGTVPEHPFGWKPEQTDEERYQEQYYAPGAMFNQAVSKFGSNPVAGGIDVLHSILQLPGSVLAPLDYSLRKLPGGKGVSDLVNGALGIPGKLVGMGEEAMGKDKELINALIASHLGVSPDKVDEVRQSLSNLNKTLATYAGGKVFGDVVKGAEAGAVKGGVEATSPTQTIKTATGQVDIPKDVPKSPVMSEINQFKGSVTGGIKGAADVIAKPVGVAARALIPENLPIKIEKKGQRAGRLPGGLPVSNRIAKTALEADIPPTKTGLAKLGDRTLADQSNMPEEQIHLKESDGLINAVDKARMDAVKESTRLGKYVDGNRVIRSLTSLKDQITKSKSSSMWETHARILDKQISWLREKTSQYEGGRIPFDEADAIRANEADIAKVYDKEGVFRQEVSKLTSRTMLKGLVEKSPVLRGAGLAERDLVELHKVISDRVNNLEKQGLIKWWMGRAILTGVATGSKTIGALEAVAELTFQSPKILHEVALLLHKARKIGMQDAEAMASKLILPPNFSGPSQGAYTEGTIVPTGGSGGGRSFNELYEESLNRLRGNPPTALPDATKPPEGGPPEGSINKPVEETPSNVVRQGDVKGRDGTVLGTEYRINDPKSPAHNANIFVRPGEDLAERIKQKEADFASAKKKVDENAPQKIETEDIFGDPIAPLQRVRRVLTRTELQDPEVRKSIQEDKTLTEKQRMEMLDNGILREEYSGQVLPRRERTNWYGNSISLAADRSKINWKDRAGQGGFPLVSGTPDAVKYLDEGAEGKERYGVSKTGIERVANFFKSKYPNIASLVKGIYAYVEPNSTSQGSYSAKQDLVWINLAKNESEAEIVNTVAHELQHAIDYKRNPINAQLSHNESVELAKRGLAYEKLPGEYKQYQVQEEAERNFVKQQLPNIFKKGSYEWSEITRYRSGMPPGTIKEFGDGGAYLVKGELLDMEKGTSRGYYSIELENGTKINTPQGSIYFHTEADAMKEFNLFIEQYSGRK